MQGVFIVVVAGGPRLGDLRAGAMASAAGGDRGDGVRRRGRRGRDGRRRAGRALVLALPRLPVGAARSGGPPDSPAPRVRGCQASTGRYRSGQARARATTSRSATRRVVGGVARPRPACAGSPTGASSRASRSAPARPRPARRRRPPGARRRRRRHAGRRPREQLPAVLGDPEGRRDQRLGRRRAEADDDLGLEDGELRLQPRPAGAQVLGAGRLVDPPLALDREPEVLDRVGDVGVAAVDAGVGRARGRAAGPAGPTNGSPFRSSWSPGCSPTNTIRAVSGPSPNTVCVAGSHSSHARQPAAAARSPSRPDAGRRLRQPVPQRSCAR